MSLKWLGVVAVVAIIAGLMWAISRLHDELRPHPNKRAKGEGWHRGDPP